MLSDFALTGQLVTELQRLRYAYMLLEEIHFNNNKVPKDLEFDIDNYFEDLHADKDN